MWCNNYSDPTAFSGVRREVEIIPVRFVCGGFSKVGFGNEKDVKGVLFHVLRELEGFGDLADVLNIPGSYVDLFCRGVPVLVVPVVVVRVVG